MNSANLLKTFCIYLDQVWTGPAVSGAIYPLQNCGNTECSPRFITEVLQNSEKDHILAKMIEMFLEDQPNS